MSTELQAHVSLGETAYQRLRADIIACRLAPGERVTEKQLSASTGLGVSPLRDALTRLDHDGLVRTLPRKGYQITPISPKSINDLFDVWELLVPEMMSRGVRLASAAQVEQLTEGFRAAEKVAQDDPGIDTALRLLQQLDETFAVLAEAADNAYLSTFFFRLSGDMARVWSLILSANPSAIDLSGLWLRDALDQHDGAAVARSTKRYIRKMRARVLAIVSKWPSVVDSEVVPLHVPVND